MKRWKTFRYKGLMVILAVFLVIGLILFAERSGIQYIETDRQVSYLDEEESAAAGETAKELHPVCLVLMDSKNATSVAAWEEFERILSDMKVSCQVVDVAVDTLPAYEDFETVVLLLTDVSPLKEEVLELADWVYHGGNAMFALTLAKESYISLIEQKLGIISSGYENAVVERIYLDEDFMVGGGRSYTITEPYESAWAVEITEKARVHAWTDDAKKLPLIWENDYGDGKFVVDNFGLYVKATRGFFAASYSLMTDACAYPVINGSAFYLDDFPSPVPHGDGTYVKRDYGTSIADFYTNIWWPDVMEMGAAHGVTYTGVIIENYGDETDGETEEQKDTQNFQYFGNMLLRQGGEIGYHGYNHQPLSLNNVDYGDVLPYETWDSYEAMKAAVKELVRFGKEMFPTVEKSVYVPPSNVLSAEGRQLLGQEFPEIRTVASTYFTGECAYTQEFEVAEDGIVEQPRIISGCLIDDYMELAAVSELNMHFVNNHFMHPDDLLDEDRGAALGWEKLKSTLSDYMDWLYESAPMIRNLTGSEMSGAVQRYCALTVQKEITAEGIELKLGNVYDEAYLMLRVNEGTPGKVTGGKLVHVTGNLYLLQAREDQIMIELER